jgi:hypothetical protein
VGYLRVMYACNGYTLNEYNDREKTILGYFPSRKVANMAKKQLLTERKKLKRIEIMHT